MWALWLIMTYFNYTHTHTHTRSNLVKNSVITVAKLKRSEQTSCAVSFCFISARFIWPVQLLFSCHLDCAWPKMYTSVRVNLNGTFMLRMRKETSYWDKCAVPLECLLLSRIGHWACVSAEVLPDSRDHMKGLKLPKRRAVIANQALRWSDRVKPRLSCCSLATFPLQGPHRLVKTIWKYFFFIAEGIRSVGKQNTETECCLWVKFINVNDVAWGAAVWLSNENKIVPPL